MRALSVAVLMAAALLCQSAAVEEKSEQQSSNEVGRTFSDWSKKFWEFMGYDYDYDYDEYEVYYPPTSYSQIGYGFPAQGFIPASAGGEHSSYSSYNPVPAGHFQHPARDDQYEEEWSLTDFLFDMAVTVVPVGLLLSALPAGLFTFAVRRRSFDDSNFLEENMDPSQLPLLQALLESDFLALADRECQMKLFCELTLLGEQDNASFMQKSLFYVATLTPDFVARRFGLQKLFRTSRAGTCSVFSCSAAYGATPKVAFDPVQTNQINEVVPEPEQEAVKVSKE